MQRNIKVDYTVLVNNKSLGVQVQTNKSWKIAFPGVSMDDAQRLIAKQPTFKQSSYKIVPAADVRKYL